MKHLGDRIRQLRGRIPQAQLAAAAGIDAGTLNRIERGRQRNPSHPTLVAIAQALNVDVNLLYAANADAGIMRRAGEAAMEPPQHFHPPQKGDPLFLLAAALRGELHSVYALHLEDQAKIATLEARVDALERATQRRGRRTSGHGRRSVAAS